MSQDTENTTPPAAGPVDRRVGLLCCSFCGKGEDELPMLVRGMGNVCICDACIDLCRDIVGLQRLSGKEGADAHQQPNPNISGQSAA